MKRIIQLSLIFFIIFTSIIFYKVYFSEKKELEVEIENIENEDEQVLNPENNLIKNLKYEIKLDNNSQYIVKSDLSEITYENSVEIVIMNQVLAIFLDQTNIPLTVTSGKAIYNNSNYNTQFSKNVVIKYLDNTIFSNNMDLDFENNHITIYKDIKYYSDLGTISADKIKIDLITKKIGIYMEDNNDSVNVNIK